MTSTIKSLVAIAIACTIGLGFTSCKKDDNAPAPSESVYGFQSYIAYHTDMAEIFDITFNYTGLDGKSTTKKLTDLPKQKVTVNGKEYEMYVFSEKQTTKSKSMQTKLEINYASKGVLPASGNASVVIAPNFVVGIPSGNTWETGYVASTSGQHLPGLTLDMDRINRLVESFNKTYSSYTLKVDSSGKFSING